MTSSASNLLGYSSFCHYCCLLVLIKNCSPKKKKEYDKGWSNDYGSEEDADQKLQMWSPLQKTMNYRTTICRGGRQ